MKKFLWLNIAIAVVLGNLQLIFRTADYLWYGHIRYWIGD